jgi:hypothetical protein
MGFFDFLDLRGGPGRVGFQTLAEPGMSATRLVQALLRLPRDQRDGAWSDQFLAHVADAAFYPGEPAVVKDPVGMPYLALGTEALGAGFPTLVLHHLEEDVLLERGLGAVINAGDTEADWAFSFGDIVHHHLYGVFYPDQVEPGAAASLPPSERVPQAVRRALRAFLGDLGVSAPGFLVSACDHAGPGSVELLFSFAPHEFRNLDGFRFAMSHISWFLPRQYSYSVAGNQARKEGAFQAL